MTVKLCESCGYRLPTFTIPNVNCAKKKNEVIRLCEPCVEELYNKVMKEKEGATLQ